jgi:hypothetical protein
MRVLLKSLYRDLFKYSIIAKIRRDNSDTTDLDYIEKKYAEELLDTKFIGVGNPSESGVHLLYYFRQENNLSKQLFINVHDIFVQTKTGYDFQYPEVKYYVFIDDFCGSGDQAKSYSKLIVELIKSMNKNIKVFYLMLFTTKEGKNNVINETLFDKVDAVFELNNSFKCFDKDSRYFNNCPKEIDINFAKDFIGVCGEKLMKSILKKDFPRKDAKEIDELSRQYKYGYKDGQLLIGFHHNTPDNSIPIFWYDEEEIAWYPIFRRYNKIYES